MPVEPKITSVVWTGTDVPSGLALDRSNGVFSGTPVNAGSSIVPVKVETNYGEDQENISIVATTPPTEPDSLEIATSEIVLEEQEAVSGSAIVVNAVVSGNGE